MGPKHFVGLCVILVVALARPAPAPATVTVDVVGDHSNPFNPIDFMNPNVGFAQQFFIGNGAWQITQARVRLGSQDPFSPVTPAVQIRDTTGPGGGPGAVLGTFNLNPNDIPPYNPSFVNSGIVTAPANSNIQLGVGSYFLTIINQQNTGGIVECFTFSSPFTQDGIGGTIANNASIWKTYDGGGTFGAAYGGYAILMELDGIAVPEPACVGMTVVGMMMVALRVRR